MQSTTKQTKFCPACGSTVIGESCKYCEEIENKKKQVWKDRKQMLKEKKSLIVKILVVIILILGIFTCDAVTHLPSWISSSATPDEAKSIIIAELEYGKHSDNNVYTIKQLEKLVEKVAKCNDAELQMAIIRGIREVEDIKNKQLAQIIVSKLTAIDGLNIDSRTLWRLVLWDARLYNSIHSMKFRKYFDDSYLFQEINNYIHATANVNLEYIANFYKLAQIAPSGTKKTVTTCRLLCLNEFKKYINDERPDVNLREVLQKIEPVLCDENYTDFLQKAQYLIALQTPNTSDVDKLHEYELSRSDAVKRLSELASQGSVREAMVTGAIVRNDIDPTSIDTIPTSFMTIRSSNQLITFIAYGSDLLERKLSENVTVYLSNTGDVPGYPSKLIGSLHSNQKDAFEKKQSLKNEINEIDLKINNLRKVIGLDKSSTSDKIIKTKLYLNKTIDRFMASLNQ